MTGRAFALVLAAASTLAVGDGCTGKLAGRDGASGDTDARSDASPSAIADGSACFPLFHACTATSECCAPNLCINITGTPACQQEGPGVDPGSAIDASLPQGIPTADSDGGTCTPSPGQSMGVVCFGSEPAPYAQYLTPDDGGAVSQRCPTPGDFIQVRGETCGYVACGPLLGSAISELPDAGAIVGDAGIDCCFVVARLCGV